MNINSFINYAAAALYLGLEALSKKNRQTCCTVSPFRCWDEIHGDNFKFAFLFSLLKPTSQSSSSSWLCSSCVGVIHSDIWATPRRAFHRTHNCILCCTLSLTLQCIALPNFTLHCTAYFAKLDTAYLSQGPPVYPACTAAIVLQCIALQNCTAQYTS